MDHIMINNEIGFHVIFYCVLLVIVEKKTALKNMVQLDLDIANSDVTAQR